LAAVQTFFRYIAGQQPSLAALCSPVLAIPAKKTLRPVLGYLSEQELGHLLAQIDRTARHGERDYVLLSVLYDTGGRIQELLDLKPRDFHLDAPPFVRLRGKGRRERLCPLLPQSAQLLRKFLATNGRRVDGEEPVFQNGRGVRLGRHGARYILLKYLRQAASSMPSLGRPAISPHTLRHTKGMHLLQSGVPLVMVKDFLGHVDMKSTEVYVQADLNELSGSPSSQPNPIWFDRSPESFYTISWPIFGHRDLEIIHMSENSVAILNTDIGRRLLKVGEAARLLGLKVDTVYKKARLREVPSVRVGRALRFDVRALERFVEQHSFKTVE